MPVSEPSHIGDVRRAAQRLAQTLPMDDAKRSTAGIIATELATNLARHAKDGRLLLQTSPSGCDPWLELLAVDSGPGIADLSRCLQDGYSSGGTPGTGFGAVRRLSDVFDAYSTPGRGTAVLARIRGDGPIRDAYVVGAVAVVAPHETVCGDAWRVAEREGAVSVVVADGLGHGPLAAEAATRVTETFAAEPFVDADTFYGRAHQALNGSRGAAVARAVVDAGGRIDFAGLGNIGASLLGRAASKGLPSQNGTVGLEGSRRITALQYPWPDGGVLVMYSDGVQSRWSLEGYPGLLARHPAVIAAVLSRDYLRGKDDATVVVVARAGRVS